MKIEMDRSIYGVECFNSGSLIIIFNFKAIVECLNSFPLFYMLNNLGDANEF
ncbi:hypothetical protein KAU33_09695 [Candidatus Dependentiae bacterium]|nr:hypothetical protein [Candidatus Dependentiae bacterium]